MVENENWYTTDVIYIGKSNEKYTHGSKYKSERNDTESFQLIYRELDTGNLLLANIKTAVGLSDFIPIEQYRNNKLNIVLID